ncbi:MAG: PEP-CTERM sorting domain-containing protein, partial [Chromatiales bacterium]
IDYTFTFSVDGEETRLQIYDALWDPLHPGLATYSIRDHTSRVTQHYNMETAPYMQSFTLEDGHVYTFNLDMTHFGRACHPKESFHIYFYDHIIMPEPSISTLWMLGLSVLGMVRRRKDLFIARNRRI